MTPATKHCLTSASAELLAIGHVIADGNWPADATGGWEWQVAQAA
ncbi:hypothetical protein [Methylopila sp. 73B]|nr:hypothetical protein [Methylopila sp. 73B]